MKVFRGKRGEKKEKKEKDKKKKGKDKNDPFNVFNDSTDRRGSTQFGLDDKINALWVRPLPTLPVYKDLPRLAPRITVNVLASRETPAASPQQQRPSSADAFAPHRFVVWLKRDLPKHETERYAASAWGEMPAKTMKLVVEQGDVNVGGGRTQKRKVLRLYERGSEGGSSNPVLSAPASKVESVCDSTRYFVICVPKKADEPDGECDHVGIAFHTRQESKSFVDALEEKPEDKSDWFFEQMAADPDKWNRIIQLAGVTPEDLKDPDIAALVMKAAEEADARGKSSSSPNSSQENLKEALGGDESSSSSSSNAATTKAGKLLRQIRDVIYKVAQQLETKERADEIKGKLDAMVDTNYDGEMELIMKELFEEGVGLDSKSARVFKVIHQNVVFVAAVILKTQVTKNEVMTKDDRSPDGWRILVTFDAASVSVSHIRRELPMAGAKKDEQFYWEWELSMKFDREMNELLATELKVVDLHFEDGINPQLKETLSRVFGNGKMMVARSG